MNKQQQLQEIKLSRVLRHFKTDEYPVGTITAFRGDTPRAQNVSNNKKLAESLRSAGYGYVFVDGGWKETQNDGSVIDVKEDSILVIGRPNDNGKLRALLLSKAKEYNQDGFLFKPEGSTKIFIVDKSGRETQISNSFRLDRFEYGYTQLRGGGKGRVFSFHEERDGSSWISTRLSFKDFINT